MIPRRTFLKSGTAAAAGAWALPRFAIGQSGVPANSKLNVAVVGVTGQGGVNLIDIAGNKHVNLAAICDVDTRLLGLAGKLWNEDATKFVVPAHTRKFTAYREMLHEMGDGLDAVLVCTPDHSHAHQVVNCLMAGKHVFSEKPMSNSIWGTRQMRAAAKKSGKITQMGIHNHMSDGLRLFKEWYDAGLPGPLREIHLWTNRPWWPYGLKQYPAALTPPDTLNWNEWLGSTEYHSYGSGIHPYDWRSWWIYGSGVIGDLACHLMDVPYFMFDLGLPERVEVLEIHGGTDISIPGGAHILFHFPATDRRGPVQIHWYEGNRMENGKKIPMRPALPKGMPADTKLTGDGRIIICEDAVMATAGVPITAPLVYPAEKLDAWRNDRKLPPKSLSRGKGSIRAEWVEAIRRNDPALASTNFDYSAGLTESVLVGNLAIRSGKSLGWDAAKMRATDNDLANTYITPPAREGWFSETFVVS
jgi:predicted dehydrogenase